MKKGFTLVELIGVIVIIGILALVTIPPTVNIIKNSKDKAYNTVINNIKISMQNWASKNTTLLPESGNKIYLTISELKHEGYIEDTLINPKTELPIPNDMLLSITNDSGYQYNVDTSTGTETTKYDDATPYITLNQNIVVTYNVGDTYNSPITSTYHGNGYADTSAVSTSLIGGGTVSTATAATYYVKYSATIDGISVAIVQTVIVKNNTATCKPTSVTTAGTYTIGDIYSCDPGDGTDRTFYVLSTGTNTVSFIMNQNIGANVAWDANNTVTLGAESALAYLKRITRNWNNVTVSLPDAQTIATAGGATAWTSTTIESTALTGWLYGNTNCKVNTCTETVDTTDTGTTLGYWTSTNYSATAAFSVASTGKIVTDHLITDSGYYGIRPVITVTKASISN